LIGKTISLAQDLLPRVDQLARNAMETRLAGIHLARIIRTPALDFYGWSNKAVLTRMLEELPREGSFTEIVECLEELLKKG